jgi:PhnB protein
MVSYLKRKKQMPQLNPYLNFDGTAEEAMTFYRSVFGGDFMGGIMRWKDIPGAGGGDGEGETEGGMQLPEGAGEKVMHMALPITGGSVIMASDVVEGFGNKFTPGNNVYIAISPESREEADRLFAGLSEGGKVEMPMSDAFWGGYFGSFTDKFGTSWLINYDKTAEAS